ncbi:NAD-dependent epimerase/dehydratase family protein [Algoriphagus sp. AGSA1]|uniref:NAD-dependent epimerase/dehydratase family protein n=1 Tax=Algoriphagus sp. AGSA1 TaxID=2907213 RepID=UPI001F433456|nr:NAD-dependent epimerase/dehydratase family protein [Algoriphagus sp. AGSA1]MCE7055292.1 NAD-dependent epimerase/dehydratase family protein [Algoriphagus sp. AGSA1]
MISVIGGSGFIGSRLCKRLNKNGFDFQIVDKKVGGSFPEKTQTADVRDYESLVNAVNGETIINLAAEHRDDVSPKSLYDEVNIDGARRICELAEAKGISKIIFTSSVAVYGFAPLGTDEQGEINYFNDYGRTKFEAEKVFCKWQEADPENRSLVVLRPTVVFGEQNRGNVYNLLKQIASGKFIMIGNGKNVKSMAYVENIAAFLEFSLGFGPGVHVYNYIDKPDFDMNTLVLKVNKALGKKERIGLKIPYFVGYTMGKFLDLVAATTGRKLPISSIRIKKFCSNTMFNTKVSETGFNPPVNIYEALESTIRHEFLESPDEEVYYTE